MFDTDILLSVYFRSPSEASLRSLALTASSASHDTIWASWASTAARMVWALFASRTQRTVVGSDVIVIEVGGPGGLT